ncbi:MAG TPA: glycosyltransferase [Gemmatimonadaceae bacterium]|nr:glycosyltransferase [Gemmatimonadaceae bacterium]
MATDGERVDARSGSLRVAAIIDAAAVSGPGRQLAALAGALASQGVALSVVAFDRRGASRAFLAYLDELGVPHEVVPERGPLDPAVIRHLRDVLSRIDPHLVQTHGYKPATLAWLLRRTGATWPWVAFFHGATSENLKVRAYNRIHRAVSRSADEVVSMAIRHLGYHRHPHQRVIHNAVLAIPSTPDQDFLRRVAALPLPSPRLLVLGRLSPEKGVDVMLRALQGIARRGPPVGLLVVGDGPERERLGRLAGELGVSERVAFLPATSDVAAAYCHCDAVVIPSRSEGLPNVLLEALSHDRPVLSTDVGAVREVLGESRAGVIVPPESPEALAAAIPTVLAMRADATAAEARRQVAQRFSLSARVAAHLQLYRDVLERRGASHA